jgi:hypothetical protein
MVRFIQQTEVLKMITAFLGASILVLLFTSRLWLV